MMKYNNYFLITLIILFCLIEQTKAGASRDVATSKEEIVIGAVLGGDRSLYWKTVEKGLMDGAKDAGVRLIVRSPADNGYLNGEKDLQLKMVKYLIANGANRIALAPHAWSPTSVPVSLNVPTVFVDLGDENVVAQAEFSTDSFAAGKKAAESMVNFLKRGSHLGVLRLAKDVQTTSERERGFIFRATELGYIIVADIYLGTSVGAGTFKIKELLSKSQSTEKKIDAVFAPNESTTESALRAISRMEQVLRPKIIGFDFSPDFMSALKIGIIQTLIVQDAYGMGYEGAKYLASKNGSSLGAKKPIMNRMPVLVINEESLKNVTTLKRLKPFLDSAKMKGQ